MTLATAQPKPKPKLIDQRATRAAVATVDRLQRQQCHVRSGGRCEVIEKAERTMLEGGIPCQVFRRCARRSSQNHHLIGGSGRRNKGKSLLSAHRLDCCDRCHQEITNHVLVPIDGTLREDAATVRYERLK